MTVLILCITYIGYCSDFSIVITKFSFMLGFIEIKNTREDFYFFVALRCILHLETKAKGREKAVL